MNKREAQAILNDFHNRFTNQVEREFKGAIKKITGEKLSQPLMLHRCFATLTKNKKEYFSNGRIKIFIKSNELKERFYLDSFYNGWYLEFQVPDKVEDLRAWKKLSKEQEEYIKKDVEDFVSEENNKKRQRRLLEAEFDRALGGEIYHHVFDSRVVVYASQKSIKITSEYNKNLDLDFYYMNLITLCSEGDELFEKIKEIYINTGDIKEAAKPLFSVIEFTIANYESPQSEEERYHKYLFMKMKNYKVDLKKSLSLGLLR
jgi:hypothetical protein